MTDIFTITFSFLILRVLNDIDINDQDISDTSDKIGGKKPISDDLVNNNKEAAADFLNRGWTSNKALIEDRRRSDGDGSCKKFKFCFLF